MYILKLPLNYFSEYQEACLKFYKDAPDRTNFDETWTSDLTIFDKLKASLKSYLQSEEDIVIIDLVDILHSKKRTSRKTNSDLENAHENASPAESLKSESQNNLQEISCM